MEPVILSKIQKWCQDPYFDDDFKGEIARLIENRQETELFDRFYQDLSFGTGGMRGIIGAGSNRINIYTLRKATQGLSNYILQIKTDNPTVAIAYDNRRFSSIFAHDTASVLAANGVKSYVFPELCPTPLLSFAVRFLKATAGIVITASHNPPEYNGYKVVWSDGSQIIAPHDFGIIKCVQKLVNFSEVRHIDFKEGLENGSICFMPPRVEDNYYKCLESLCFGRLPKQNADYGILYSPLHGTGKIPMERIMKRRGFKKFRLLEAQSIPDPDFSTLQSPNPEEDSAYEEALISVKKDEQLIITSDPDADRIGVKIRQNTGKNEWHGLSGNQIGQLLLEYYLSEMKKNNVLPEDGYIVTTIVTSELGAKIAKSFNIRCHETLTGFKYIGNLVTQMESMKKGSFIFAYEESHGYQFGNFLREKDGISAAMMFSEMSAKYAKQALTPLHKMSEIYDKYGYHEDLLVNRIFSGGAGAQRIVEIMSLLRVELPKKLGNVPVVKMKDYYEQVEEDFILGGGKHPYILQPKSNVLAIYLEDGSRITARPSGTEPKIKFYFNLCGSHPEILSRKKYIYEKDLLDFLSID